MDEQPVVLAPRALDVLLVLVERRDRLVSKDDLLQLAWPGLVVEENNVAVQISALRKILGAEAIATVAKHGYRFTLVPTDVDTLPRQPPLPAMSVGVAPFIPEDVRDERRATTITHDFAAMLARTGSFMSVFSVTRERTARVRYLAEGDVSRETGRVVVDVRLLDAATGQQLWSDSAYLASSQDPEINGRRLHAVAWHGMRAMLTAETARLIAQPQGELEPLDLAMLAIALDRRETDIYELMRRKEALLEEALRRDPNCVPALLGLALTLDLRIRYDLDADHHALVRRMERLTARAARMNEMQPSAWAIRATALMYDGQWEASIEACMRAIALEPFACAVHIHYAWAIVMCGRPMDALDIIKQAISTDDKRTAAQMQLLCKAFLLLGRHDEAIEAGEKSLGLAAIDDFDTRVDLMAAYANAGRDANAKAECDTIHRLQPRYSLVVHQARRCSGHPQYVELLEKHLYPGLRKAGLAEA